jgi:hypothetical protein
MKGHESFKTLWLKVMCNLFYHLSPTIRNLSFSMHCFKSFLCIFYFTFITKWLCEIMMVYNLWPLQNLHSILRLPFSFLSSLTNYSLFFTLSPQLYSITWRSELARSKLKQEVVSCKPYLLYCPIFGPSYLSYFFTFTFLQTWLCFLSHF